MSRAYFSWSQWFLKRHISWSSTVTSYRVSFKVIHHIYDIVTDMSILLILRLPPFSFFLFLEWPYPLDFHFFLLHMALLEQVRNIKYNQRNTLESPVMSVYVNLRIQHLFYIHWTVFKDRKSLLRNDCNWGQYPICQKSTSQSNEINGESVKEIIDLNDWRKLSAVVWLRRSFIFC